MNRDILENLEMNQDILKKFKNELKYFKKFKIKIFQKIIYHISCIIYYKKLIYFKKFRNELRYFKKFKNDLRYNYNKLYIIFIIRNYINYI